MDASLQNLVQIIRQNMDTFSCEKDGNLFKISLIEIQYFESVDDQTYLYTKHEVYRCDKRLYEIEQQIKNARFVRISKSCIVNIECLVHVNPLYDGKFETTTVSGELLIINRHYVKAFKEAFGL